MPPNKLFESVKKIVPAILLGLFFFASSLPLSVFGQANLVTNTANSPDLTNQIPTSVTKKDLAVLGLTVMLGLYVMTFFITLGQAKRSTASSGGKTILVKIKEWDGCVSNYGFIITTFVLSIGITFVPEMKQFFGAIDSSTSSHSAAHILSEMLYFLSVANLTVLITLEISYAFSFKGSDRVWLHLLVTALVVDLIAYFFLIFAVTEPDLKGDGIKWIETSWTTVIFLLATLIGSFVSSAFVIICSKESK